MRVMISFHKDRSLQYGNDDIQRFSFPTVSTLELELLCRKKNCFHLLFSQWWRLTSLTGSVLKVFCTYRKTSRIARRGTKGPANI